MTPTGKISNIAPGHGGIRRDPSTLSSHRFRGSDQLYLQSYLRLSLQVEASDDKVKAVVEVQVRNVGHMTPTGHPSRALLVWIWATDGNGRPLEQVTGPVLPALAGDGPPQEGGLAGQPGKIYAKVLEDTDGNQPVPYWRVTRIAYDTRLKPDQVDRQEFTFRNADGASLHARLIYRRFSKQVADEKGWVDNEILVQEVKWSPRLEQRLPSASE